MSFIPSRAFANLNDEITNMENELVSLRCSEGQLERMAKAIKAAALHVRSMGSECDHAEIVLGVILAQRASAERLHRRVLDAAVFAGHSPERRLMEIVAAVNNYHRAELGQTTEQRLQGGDK